MGREVAASSDNDQAAALRKLVSRKHVSAGRPRSAGMRSVTILSGKGGVGKSNVAVNLAVALADDGYRVALLDADLGLASIDILFGIVPEYNLAHVLRGEKELSDIVCKVRHNVFLIPGGAGLRDIADLDEQRQQWMLGRLAFLEDDIDIMILDASAGIHKNVLSFAISSDLSIVLTTVEPTSVRDAYGVIKSLCQITGGASNLALAVTMASSSEEASSVAARIIAAADQFLDYDMPYLGCVLWDQAVRDAVRARKPVMLSGRETPSVQCFRDIAKKVAVSSGLKSAKHSRSGSFLRRLARHMP